jgi:hypothetical protein
LYKEDFNKFLKALSESLDYVKTDLMPDFDFDAFNHEFDPENSEPKVDAIHHSVLPEVIEPTIEITNTTSIEPTIEPSIAPEPTVDNLSAEEVDKW